MRTEQDAGVRSRRLARVLPALACPACTGSLALRTSVLVCTSCGCEYDAAGGVARLRRSEPTTDEGAYAESWKAWIRRRPTLYRAVHAVCVPVLRTGPDPGTLLAPLLARGGIVLDVGAGNDRRHRDFVNVDLIPYPEVDIVADAHHLPFKDASVDGVISVAVLEHVTDPGALLQEVARVLRHDGEAYIVAPFLAPFHAAPADFRRWTQRGLVTEVEMTRQLTVIASGVNGGPASALAWFLSEWTALVLSAGSRRLRALLSPLFQGLLAPLKLLDLFLGSVPGAADLAVTVYVHAAKRTPGASRA